MSSRNLLHQGFWSTLSTGIERGVLVLASIIAANSLTSLEYASYNYFQLTTSMLAISLSMGISVISTKEFARKNTNQENYADQLWVVSLYMATISMIFIWLIPEAYINSEFNYSTWIFPVAVFLLMMNIAPNGGVIGLEKYKYGAIVSAASALTLMFGSVWAYIHSSLDLAIYALIFYIFMQSIGNTILVSLVSRMDFRQAFRSVTFLIFLQILKKMGPLSLVAVLTAFLMWISGRMLIEHSTEYEFSLYAIGIQWFALILFLPGVVSRIFMPKLISKSALEKDNSEFEELIKKGVRWSALSSMIIGLLCISMSPILIKLYGFRYENEIWLISLFALYAIPFSPINLLNNALIADNKELTVLVNTVIWFTFAILITYYLSEYGVYFVVTGLFFSTCLLLLLVRFSVKKHLNVIVV